MSKILLLTDTHYGVRKDNVNFYEYQKKFLHKVFFPFIDKYTPDAIIHMGDLVDNRKSIEYRSYDRMVSDYLDPMSQYEGKIPHYWLAGNHDAYHRNSLDINAISHFTKSGEVVDSPRDVRIGKETFCLIPWICDSNIDDTKRIANASTANYCFGHLELTGFEKQRGSICNDGFDPSVFSNFDITFSGHFHNRSYGGNIRYIGAAFQFDWSDAGEYRGMALLDTDTSKVQYCKNPFTMFNVIEYTGNNEIDAAALAGTYVRVFVKEKPSETAFDDFISRLQDIETADLSIVDNSIKKIELSENVIIVDEVKDVCQEYIAKSDIPYKNEVSALFNDLHTESLK